MIFRNGFKEYALMGIIYGLSMGIFFGVTSKNAIGGIISGVICGILFAFFMYLFIHKQEKKFDIKREEISKETNKTLLVKTLSLTDLKSHC